MESDKFMKVMTVLLSIVSLLLIVCSIYIFYLRKYCEQLKLEIKILQEFIEWKGEKKIKYR